jgi:hypothetical protein
MRRLEPHAAIETLKAGMLCFAVVFGAGFVLGPIRILWAAPRFGPRLAELMEMPIMLVVVVVAARSIVRRLAVPAAPARRLGMGSVALTLLLTAEFTPVLRLRGLSIPEYVAGLDPVSGPVYAGTLCALVVMPLLVARDRGHRDAR